MAIVFTKQVDVSKEAVAYARMAIAGMPGNAGQQVLVDKLTISAWCYMFIFIEVDLRGKIDIKITTLGSCHTYSTHPEAIHIIMDRAEEAFEEFKAGLEGNGFIGLAQSLNMIEQIAEDAKTSAYDDWIKGTAA